MTSKKPRRTFISYSRINKDFALQLALELRSSGFDVWLDQLDIPTGSRWDDEVEDALEDCEIFMVILTPASSTSDNVKDEIGYAIDTGKRILPILLENAKVPLRLRRFQYVDFTRKDYDEGVESAKKLLRRLTEQPTMPRDQAPVPAQEQKAEADRMAKEARRVERKKAEEERLAKEKLAADQLTAQNAEAERKAKEKAEADRRAREKREAERLASQKAEQERKAREEAVRVAGLKAAEERVVVQPETGTAPEKNNRMPLILGAVGAGVIVLGVAVVAIANMLSNEVPASAPTDESLSANLVATNTVVTEIPPTKTSTPEPTATPEPRSGDLLYETDFEDFDRWQTVTKQDESEYINEVQPEGIFVQVPDADDYWFAYYDLGNDLNDVRLEADVELVGGSNYTYINLVCRSSDKGEYIFSLDTGGFWQIGKYDFESDSYEQLGYGGTTSIRVAKNPNHMTVICSSDNLTMFINDVEVGSAQDSQFSDGDIGIGVDTFDFPLAEVVFQNLEIYVP